LHQQKIYWKQRGAIKWVKFGDAGTQFFHANATIKLRRNYITSLQKYDNTEVLLHADKAEILWNAFKERLGTSNTVQPPNNLEEMLQAASNLDVLESPFTHEEIDLVVKNLPAGKSPGPDGFNNEFLRKCWPIISPDFYEL
jgi:hypothetical protein